MQDTQFNFNQLKKYIIIIIFLLDMIESRLFHFLQNKFSSQIQDK